MPTGFAPAGKVEWAQLSDSPHFSRRVAKRGRRAEGVRYERKVQAALCDLLGDSYLPSPWVRYLSVGSEKPRYCQPDGLIFNLERGSISIVEVKLSHTQQAWWQLCQLYLPVVKALFQKEGMWDFPLVEVCRWFDPAVQFPIPIHMAPVLRDLPAEKFSVHIFTP